MGASSIAAKGGLPVGPPRAHSAAGVGFLATPPWGSVGSKWPLGQPVFCLPGLPRHVFILPFQARMVAAATNNLCEAANAAVQGHASEEKLISSAKQVAASTAQLLVACKVKADQDSEAMKRLQVSRDLLADAACLPRGLILS